MIELRWVYEHRGYIEKERVLQSRVQRQVREFHGKAGVTTKLEWTEWQDVPTVSDGAARGD